MRPLHIPLRVRDLSETLWKLDPMAPVRVEDGEGNAMPVDGVRIGEGRALVLVSHGLDLGTDNEGCA